MKAALKEMHRQVGDLKLINRESLSEACLFVIWSFQIISLEPRKSSLLLPKRYLQLLPLISWRNIIQLIMPFNVHH